MKKEGIKIRIGSELKDEFKKVCDQESFTMSDKIHDFIFSEVESKKTKNPENNLKELIKQLGYENVYYVDFPCFIWNNEEKEINKSEDGGKFMQVSTWHMNILDFLKENSDKTVLIYLNGCDFSKNNIRGVVIEN